MLFRSMVVASYSNLSAYLSVRLPDQDRGRVVDSFLWLSSLVFILAFGIGWRVLFWSTDAANQGDEELRKTLDFLKGARFSTHWWSESASLSGSPLAGRRVIGGGAVSKDKRQLGVVAVEYDPNFPDQTKMIKMDMDLSGRGARVNVVDLASGRAAQIQVDERGNVRGHEVDAKNENVRVFAADQRGAVVADIGPSRNARSAASSANSQQRQLEHQPADEKQQQSQRARPPAVSPEFEGEQPLDDAGSYVPPQPSAPQLPPPPTQRIAAPGGPLDDSAVAVEPAENAPLLAKSERDSSSHN
mgnify:CR=1 FL=1